ncbi:MAG: squalene/phytoene synthase family protein [Micropepsaceae bacterium]
MDQSEAESALETFEPDRFVSLFFVPQPHRPAVQALYAFELELSRIATQVGEPMVGQIRYAWWREQIDALYSGRAVSAPAAQAVAPFLDWYSLPRVLFDDMIDWHARDLDAAPFADIEQMKAYACSTAGALMKLGVRVLGAGGFADEAATLAGTAYGLARQLQEFRHWASHRRLRLPLRELEAAGLDAEDVFQGRADDPRLKPLFDLVKGEIRQQLSALNAARFPRAATPILAVASLARVASRRQFNPLDPARAEPWQRFLRLSASNLLWRF